jgi:hypothetical protein
MESVNNTNNTGNTGNNGNTDNTLSFCSQDFNPTGQCLNLTGQEKQQNPKARKRKHIEVEYEKYFKKRIGIFRFKL